MTDDPMDRLPESLERELRHHGREPSERLDRELEVLIARRAVRGRHRQPKMHFRTWARPARFFSATLAAVVVVLVGLAWLWMPWDRPSGSAGIMAGDASPPPVVEEYLAWYELLRGIDPMLLASADEVLLEEWFVQ